MNRRRFLRCSTEAGLGACLLPLAGCAPRAPRTPTTHDDEASSVIAELEKLIPKLMQEARVPGSSIALVKDGELFWRRGFGVKDSASGEQVDHETVFEAASVSKTVFAYVVMKLVERGVLGLDTPLTEYSPTPFLEGDPRLELITARHVLSHTGGFQDWRSNETPLKIHFTPGERFLYSGEGYYYLQSVVTHLTGRVNPNDCARYEADFEVCATDIDPFIRRNLLVPFGMDSSGYVWNDTFEKHVARPHDSSASPLAKAKPTATDAARYASAGGLHTTATDYAKFLIEILGPKSGDAFRLSRSSLEEMILPQVKLPEDGRIDGASSWALGWAVQERPTGNVLVHSGGQAGFRSLAMASVERRSGFIILTNGDSGGRVIYDEAFDDAMNRLLAGSL
jgi:CubicO group peptidase (beta-lactamase class C family)